MLEWKDTGSLGRTAKDDDEAGGVTLYVTDQLECVEVCLGMNEKLTDSL